MAGRGKLSLVRRGGTGTPLVLEHSGARLSWVINGPGDFSCILPAATARRFGASGINWLGGKWIRYEHPDLPDWGGVVTQAHWTDDGSFELVAQSFHVLARKRRVNLNVGRQRATAGALASRAHGDVQSDDPTGITEFRADEYGDPVDYEWRGGDLMDDVLPQLVSASGQEWTVDADRIAYWRVRLGRDKSDRICLRHPVEIVSHTYSGDLWTATNDIEGVGADDKYADAAYDQADDDDSVKLRGRLMTSVRYADVVSKGTIRPKILRDLKRLRNPAQTISVQTVNLGHVWSQYVLGDEVLISLPHPNIFRVARIEARSVDVDSGIETLGLVIR